MSKLIKKFVATNSVEITNAPDDDMFDTSLANALRRTNLLASYCWAILEEVPNEHKVIFNDLFKLNYEEKEKIFAVSACNYLNIEALSHRLNRMPLYYNKENEHLYTQGLIICLTEKNNFNSPYVHKAIEPRLIYSKDLTFLTISPGGLIELTPEEKNSIIKFNVHLYTLKQGDSIFAMAMPVNNCGYEGSEFEPITATYNFGLDAKPDYHRRDVFDNPDNIYLTLIFAGKKDIVDSWNESLTYLSNQINTFITEYVKALMSESDVIKITNCEFNLQEIDVYNSNCYLADHTLGNLLSCHVLMKMTNLLYEYSKEDEELFHELYSQMLISYIAPDESSITRSIKIKFQTPEHVGFNDFIKENYATGTLAYHKHNTKLCILYSTTTALIKYLRTEE
jgi:hypothetical protein